MASHEREQNAITAGCRQESGTTPAPAAEGETDFGRRHPGHDSGNGRVSFRQAVAHGATERLVPRALAAGEPGSEIQVAMAVVILFGLLSSTVLNMFVVPGPYLRFGSIAEAFSGDDANTLKPMERPT